MGPINKNTGTLIWDESNATPVVLPHVGHGWSKHGVYSKRMAYDYARRYHGGIGHVALIPIKSSKKIAVWGSEFKSKEVAAKNVWWFDYTTKTPRVFCGGKRFISRKNPSQRELTNLHRTIEERLSHAQDMWGEALAQESVTYQDYYSGMTEAFKVTLKLIERESK